MSNTVEISTIFTFNNQSRDIYSFQTFFQLQQIFTQFRHLSSTVKLSTNFYIYQPQQRYLLRLDICQPQQRYLFSLDIFQSHERCLLSLDIFQSHISSQFMHVDCQSQKKYLLNLSCPPPPLLLYPPPSPYFVPTVENSMLSCQ